MIPELPPDYSQMTAIEEDDILEQLIKADGISSVLNIGDIRSILKKEYNNAILERWEQDNPDAKKYPDCYLHVRECRSGEEWIQEIKGNMTLNLETRIRHWCKTEMSGELALDGKIMPQLDGDYYGKIMTDGRPPNSAICWYGGGFYLKTTY